MADNVNAITSREHETAEDLQCKVDQLLVVVNKVAEGDFSARIDISGEDAMGELFTKLKSLLGKRVRLGFKQNVALIGPGERP